MTPDLPPDLPPVEFAFPGPLRDAIVAAVLAGDKTSTSSLLREYERADEPLPAVGDRGVVLDSEGGAVAVVETTAVSVVPLHAVDLDHAIAEGEGYADVAAWRRGHERFWRSDGMRAELGDGFELDDDTQVVLERFAVVR